MCVVGSPGAGSAIWSSIRTTGSLVWAPASDNNWVSYYEVLKNGAVVAKAAKGTFYFDYKDGRSLDARNEVRTVDGDGNRSPFVAAKLAAGDAETYTALGGFSPTQGAGQWRYEEAVEGPGFSELR